MRAVKPFFSQFGEMLFYSQRRVRSRSADSLICTSDFSKHKYKICIDLKPALSESELDARILRDFKNTAIRDFINSLVDLLPRKIIPVIVEKIRE